MFYGVSGATLVVRLLMSRPVFLITLSIEQCHGGQVVKGPSSSQALKGILTAGPYKAARYSLVKLQKMLKSMLR